MIKKLTHAAIMLLVFSSLLAAQSWRGKGRLEGSVKDPDGKPIEGATIKLECVKYGGGFEVKSDKNGRWVAAGIRGSDWNLDISAPGFMLKQLSNYLSEVNRNKPVDVVLDRDASASAAAASAVQRQEAMSILTKGNELFKQGKIAEALSEYQAILAKNPELTIVNLNIANCYYEMKQLDKAIEAISLHLAADPTNADAITRIGNIYAEQGNLEKALEYFGKIDQSLIRNPVTFYNIGILLFNNQKTAESLGYFQKAVTVDPSFADGHYQIGLCYLNQGDMPKAKESLKKFLEIAPDHPNAAQVQAIISAM